MTQPTRKPTAGEYRILAYIFIAVAVGFGAVCIYHGFAKMDKNPDAAELLRNVGFVLLGGGLLGPFMGKIFMRIFFD